VTLQEAVAELVALIDPPKGRALAQAREEAVNRSATAQAAKDGRGAYRPHLVSNLANA